VQELTQLVRKIVDPRHIALGLGLLRLPVGIPKPWLVVLVEPAALIPPALL